MSKGFLIDVPVLVVEMTTRTHDGVVDAFVVLRALIEVGSSSGKVDTTFETTDAAVIQTLIDRCRKKEQLRLTIGPQSASRQRGKKP